MPTLSTFVGLCAVARIVLAAPAASGTFNVLAFNVAGLPAFLNDNGVPGDKTTNTQYIGQALAKYGHNIVQVQEDFNYHSTLYKYDNHPSRTSTSGGVPFGSGLNTLSTFTWTDFKRVTWDDCSNASEYDCLTPKGFTFMRIRVAEGVVIDAVNVHTDAGTKDGDYVARNSNLLQVSNYLTANSAGNAVLIFGDTNSRYTRAGDTALRTLIAQQGLTDAWVANVRGGSAPAPGSTVPSCPDLAIPPDASCEGVDKVLFRGSKSVQLTSTGFFYDTARFLSPNGTVLSDHNPVRVEFSWALNS